MRNDSSVEILCDIKIIHQDDSLGASLQFVFNLFESSEDLEG